GYALGPRQLQIRDALLDLSNADEQAMLDIALDHRALYMENWHRLILEALTPRALEGHLAREQFYDYVSNWSGNASVDDVGYRLVREYNDALKLKILSALGRYFLSLSPDVKDDIDDGFMQKLNHETEMVWRLLDERPMNWLSPEYASWDELLIETVDDVIADLGGLEKLARSTWGQRNTAEIRHPLSNAIPVFGSLMNMPAVALNGDVWMPRAQRASQGVSERMVVAPGHEKDAIFHMPGGQSGHPLSPFFRTGYMDWVNGQPSRFLPGEVKHTLMLKP
ncbi:MAG: penicillin acylase family protein, partial [Endozoicomonas sp.]